MSLSLHDFGVALPPESGAALVGQPLGVAHLRGCVPRRRVDVEAALLRSMLDLVVAQGLMGEKFKYDVRINGEDVLQGDPSGQ